MWCLRLILPVDFVSCGVYTREDDHIASLLGVSKAEKNYLLFFACIVPKKNQKETWENNFGSFLDV